MVSGINIKRTTGKNHSATMISSIPSILISLTLIVNTELERVEGSQPSPQTRKKVDMALSEIFSSLFNRFGSDHRLSRAEH